MPKPNSAQAARREYRLYGAVLFGPADTGRLCGLHAPVQFRSGREASILTGQNLIPLYQGLGTQNQLNYVQNGHGFNASASKMLRRSFARVGITYGYDDSRIVPGPGRRDPVFYIYHFPGRQRTELAGGYQDQLDHAVLQLQHGEPSHLADRRKSLFISTQFAGSVSAVTSIPSGQPSTPSISSRTRWHRSHIFGVHFMGSMLTGYGGKVAPPFARTLSAASRTSAVLKFWGITPIA